MDETPASRHIAPCSVGEALPPSRLSRSTFHSIERLDNQVTSLLLRDLAQLFPATSFPSSKKRGLARTKAASNALVSRTPLFLLSRHSASSLLLSTAFNHRARLRRGAFVETLIRRSSLSLPRQLNGDHDPATAHSLIRHSILPVGVKERRHFAWAVTGLFPANQLGSFCHSLSDASSSS